MGPPRFQEYIMHIYRRLLGELVYNLMMIIGERIESDYSRFADNHGEGKPHAAP